MASFDIVSKVDGQSLDNAINSVKREITNRYDFKGSDTTIELDKKTNQIHIVTDNDMRMGQVEGVIIGQLVKNKISPDYMDMGKELYAAGKMLKKDIIIKQGIDRETAKKIVKSIKTTKYKVQASIMDDQLRVVGKKLDDLQGVIAHCKSEDFGVPLQYNNFK